MSGTKERWIAGVENEENIKYRITNPEYRSVEVRSNTKITIAPPT